MPSPGNRLSCSFCGQNQQQVKKLIAGAAGISAYICDGCVRSGHQVIAEPGRVSAAPSATIQLVGGAASVAQCSFCGMRRDQVAAMASAADTRICDGCLKLCDEILGEEPTVPVP